MKFDTIIIGGGLSGLTCGIALGKKGKKAAVVCGGQSSLHFNSGSFDLMGYNDGKAVDNPAQTAGQLPGTHPYAKVNDIEALAKEAKQLLEEAGIGTKGDCNKNHYRLSPIGKLMPTWLTMDGLFTVDNAEELKSKKICLANITGFLDFPVPYIANGLRELGAEVSLRTVTTPLLEHARQSPSEMRATNIANYLANDNNVKEVAEKLKAAVPAETDLLLLPAVLGVANDHAVKLLQDSLSVDTRFVATMPPSVPGIRVQTLLRQCFQRLGGTLIPNNTVVKGELDGKRLKKVYTDKLCETALEADNFVFAAGSFLGGGLTSNYEGVQEPILNLDVDADADRTKWTSHDLYDKQPYQSYGVKTVGLKATKNGQTLDNVYAIGSILSGNDPRMATSTGIDLLTALAVASTLTSSDKR